MKRSKETKIQMELTIRQLLCINSALFQNKLNADFEKEVNSTIGDQNKHMKDMVKIRDILLRRIQKQLLEYCKAKDKI